MTAREISGPRCGDVLRRVRWVRCWPLWRWLAFAGIWALVTPGTAPAQIADPRAHLHAGWMDAQQAARGLRLVQTLPRSGQFAAPLADSLIAALAFANSDLAFQDDFVFQGNYNGFQVWDVSSPARPVLRAGFVCPGGQGDMSVYGHLLFMSVDEIRGRVDCGAQGAPDTVSADRIRSVRIFDIRDLDHDRAGCCRANVPQVRTLVCHTRSA